MIGFSNSMSDRDLGAQALLAEFKGIEGAVVDSVLFEGETHPDSEYTLAQIGAVNEFGSRDGRIPERPWLRRATDENKAKWDAAMEHVRDAVIAGQKILPLLVAFGERVASDIRGTIDKVTTPPKAESTIRSEGGPLKRTKTGAVRKGAREHQGRFTHPLIWLGLMRASVRSRISLHGQGSRMTAKGGGAH